MWIECMSEEGVKYPVQMSQNTGESKYAPRNYTESCIVMMKSFWYLMFSQFQ